MGIFMTSLICVLIGATIIMIIMYFFPIVTVCGDSMYPAYKNKEKIISTRLFYPDKLKSGDVVVFIPPSKTRDEIQFVIKRVYAVNEDGKIFFLGDNSEISYDSRDYGYVDKSRLVSKVIKPRPKQNATLKGVR